MFAVRIDPAAPLRGDSVMFPVVLPPRVRVFPRRDWIVEFEASRDNPLLFDAEIVATGRSDAIPVTANLADSVVVPPTAKSNVSLIGESRFELSWK